MHAGAKHSPLADGCAGMSWEIKFPASVTVA